VGLIAVRSGAVQAWANVVRYWIDGVPHATAVSSRDRRHSDHRFTRKGMEAKGCAIGSPFDRALRGKGVGLFTPRGLRADSVTSHGALVRCHRVPPIVTADVGSPCERSGLRRPAAEHADE